MVRKYAYATSFYVLVSVRYSFPPRLLEACERDGFIGESLTGLI